MNTAYRSQPVSTALFSEADAQYGAMKEALSSEEFERMTESEVERWLSEQQRELMRRLHQAHVTLRCQAEVETSVVGSDGLTRTHVRLEQSRNLETVFGTVEVARTADTLDAVCRRSTRSMQA